MWDGDIGDGRVLRLVLAFLKAGLMQNGVCRSREEGTPQGGPLSPLLANVVLDELDKELERRGHRFCRYADDCNIYVRSQRAGERVMESMTRFIERKLRLKVNKAKSKVAPSRECKFLGYTIGSNGQLRIAPKHVSGVCPLWLHGSCRTPSKEGAILYRIVKGLYHSDPSVDLVFTPDGCV